MSVSFNQATFTGNLGRDPEIRYTPQGTPICDFSIAVNVRKKVEGEWKDEAMWVKVKVWGKQAESCSQFLSKGRPVLVTGRISLENWTGREGKEMTTLVLDATDVKFLGDGGSGGNTQRSERPQSSDRPKASTPPNAPAPEPEISDDDIPF